MDMSHVKVWIFDLDNTLYPPRMALFPQIEARMTAYVMRLLDVERDHADHLRRDYWRRHGTTLAGLMAEHAVDPLTYLDEVHDIDFSPLVPAHDLAAAIAALPGRKIVHTNGDSRYARKVLSARALDLFDAVYGVEEAGFHPKPQRAAYDAIIAQDGIDPAKAAFFEDDPRNLEIPHALGMRTVLVGPGRNGPDDVAPKTPHASAAYVDHCTDDLAGLLTAIVQTGKLG